MAPLLTACSAFLLAVLWMDLIFDVQVFEHRDGDAELPEPVLASIAGYYRRATTTSRPMSRLIALVMLILLGALGFQAAYGRDPVWLLVISAAPQGFRWHWPCCTPSPARSAWAAASTLRQSRAASLAWSAETTSSASPACSASWVCGSCAACRSEGA